MKVRVEITSSDVRKMIAQKIAEEVPNVAIEENNIGLFVKSKQNYRNDTWEVGDLKVAVEYDTDLRNQLPVKP